MRKRIFWHFGVALSLCLLAGQAWPQVLTGKITGRVTQANGAPLPGVNVVVKETRFGAVADAEGIYVIIGVEPGIYELQGSMVGYETVVRRNVQVAAGRTTQANFTLRETAIEAAGIVVTAERPLIEMDQTGSETKILEEAIEQIPILRDVKEHLQYVAGVDVLSVRTGSGYRNSNGVRIRREHGDHTDAQQTWTLDGMEVTLLDVGFYTQVRQYNNLPVTSIAEMAVVKGGPSAAQAPAVSGVVNMVTREGTRVFHGGVDVRVEPPGKRHRGPNVYDAVAGQRGGANGLWLDKLKWNDPAWVNEVDPVTGKQIHVKQDYEGTLGHLMEGWLSGPMGRNATFFLSGKTARAKQVFPAPERLGLRQWSLFGKLTYTLSDNLKLKLAYNQSNEPMWRGDVRGPDANLFLIRGHTGYEQQQRNRIAYLTVTHTISPKTFHEFQVGFYATNNDTTEDTDRTTGNWRRDKTGQFNVDRPLRQLYIDDNRRYNFRYDFTSQVSRRNLLKTGFTHQVFNNTNLQYLQTSPSSGNVWLIAEDSMPGERYVVQRFGGYVEDKVEFQGLIVNAGIRYDRLWGGPQKAIGGWYRGMPGHRTFHAYSTRTPRGHTKPMVTWAPRFGISHPLTDRSVLRYAFGIYYKPAPFGQIWGEGWAGNNLAKEPNLHPNSITWKDEPQWAGAGWPLDSMWHKPGGMTNTTEFEVAAEWNFVGDLVLDLGAYYRRTERVTGAVLKRFFDPIQGQINLSGGQGPHGRFEAKGLEVSIYKPFSHNFSFRVSLDMGWSLYNIASGIGVPRGHYFYPDSTYIASANYFFVDANDNPVPLTDAQIRNVGRRANEALKSLTESLRVQTDIGVRTTMPRPFREYPNLSESERNLPEIQGLWYTSRLLNNKRSAIFPPPVAQASFQFLWSTPPGWGPGPTVGGSKLLGGIHANLVWRFDSGDGLRYTPPGTTNERSLSGPMFVRADLNFQKTFDMGTVRPTLYAEVFNLFNSYVDRGAGHPGINYLRWGLYAPEPNNQSYLKFGDPMPFRGGAPRYVNVGARFRF